MIKILVQCDHYNVHCVLRELFAFAVQLRVLK